MEDEGYQCDKVHDGGQVGYVCLAPSRGIVAHPIDVYTRQAVCSNRNSTHCAHLSHPIIFIKVKPKV
mgnify:CR=1 FL=1